MIADRVPSAPQIALVGDLHLSWDDADTDYFNASSYELLLFTGDLGASGPRDGVKIARSLGRLNRPALVILGNNDAADHARITAELGYQQGRELLLGDLERTLPPPAEPRVRVCGLDAHRFTLGSLAVTVIAGRPFAMGGDEFSSPRALAESFGVTSLGASAARLTELVDRAETEHLIFLSHNGPRGLGGEADAPWGRDFHPAAGDWGDTDLAEAIQHARASGRRVLAVVAGHMHWPLRGGGRRRWLLEKDGTLYVNAARVPRRIAEAGGARRHHIALSLTSSGAEAVEVVIVA